MVDTGWTIAGAGASVAGSGEPWASPGNITADDGNYANADGAAKNEDTYYLKASDFGFSIPSGATIDGVEARVQAYDQNDRNAYIFYISVWESDAIPGNDLETGNQDLAGSATDYDYGGATELWGLTLTPAKINSSDFQCRFRCNASTDGSAAGNPRVDAIWLKIYYTEASASAPSNNSPALLIGI